jgi:hypothetical protein
MRTTPRHSVSSAVRDAATHSTWADRQGKWRNANADWGPATTRPRPSRSIASAGYFMHIEPVRHFSMREIVSSG